MTFRRRFQPSVSNHPKPKGRPTRYPRIIQESRFLSNLPYPESSRQQQVWLGGQSSFSHSPNNAAAISGDFQFLSIENEKEDAWARLMPGDATFKKLTLHFENPVNDTTGQNLPTDLGLKIKRFGTNVFEDTKLIAYVPHGEQNAIATGSVVVNKGDEVTLRKPSNSVIPASGIHSSFGILSTAVLFETHESGSFYYGNCNGVNAIESEDLGFITRRNLFNSFENNSINSVLNGGNTGAFQIGIASVSGTIKVFRAKCYVSVDPVDSAVQVLPRPGTGIQLFLIKVNDMGHVGPDFNLEAYISEEIVHTFPLLDAANQEFEVPLNVHINEGEMWCIGSNVIGPAPNSIVYPDGKRISELFKFGFVFKNDSGYSGLFMLGNGCDASEGFSDEENPNLDYMYWGQARDIANDENDYQHVAPANMLMRNFYLRAEKDSHQNNLMAVRSRINGKFGNLRADIPVGGFEAKDLTFEDKINEGDLINMGLEHNSGFGFARGWTYNAACRVI